MRTLLRLLARLPWGWIALVSLAVSLGLFVVSVSALADGEWDVVGTSAAHHGWLLAWLLGVSFLARSRSLVNVIAAFLGGFFSAMWIAVTLGERTEDWLGANDPWQLVVVVPVIEELAKALPLLVVVLAWRGRRDGTPGAVDLAILGTAAGAGFALHEDLMWERIAGSGAATPLGWLLPTAHTAAGTVLGHAGWTGLVGLGLGVWHVNRHRRWAFVAPVVAVAVVVADHGLWNNGQLRETWRSDLGGGWVPVALFLGGVLAATVVETRVVHRVTEGRTTRIVRVLPTLLRRARNPWNLVLRWHRLVGFLRLCALTAHRVASLERGAPVPHRAIEVPT